MRVKEIAVRYDFKVFFQVTLALLLAFLIVINFSGGTPKSCDKGKEISREDEMGLLMISPDEIIDRMTTTVEGLKAYKAKVKISLVVHSLSNLGMTVHGELYVRNPDLVRLKLLDIPEAIARKYQTSFSKTVVPGIASKNYKKRYNISFVGLRNYRGERCFLLLLKPKKEGNVTRVLMWVSTEDYTVPKVIIFYKDGGRILLTQEYEKVRGKRRSYLLISSQAAEMIFPKVKATLKSHFFDYQLFEEEGKRGESFEGENG